MLQCTDFVKSVRNNFVLNGRKTTIADEVHCQGVGPRSYGTGFEAAGCDENNQIQPPFFFFSITMESNETWLNMFRNIK